MEHNKKQPPLQTETVELVTTSTSKTRFYYARVENLEGNKVIESIRMYNATDFAKAPSNAAVINTTSFGKGFLTMTEKGKEVISKLPLAVMRTAANNGEKFKTELKNVDFQKSYVEFSETTGLAAGEALVAVFEYRDYDRK